MSSSPLSIKTVVAIVIGNALLWYDFTLYSFLTIEIARLYFPATNPTNALLAAIATFGVAFLVRPVGGFLFGVYADKYGRRSAMVLMMSLMVLAVLMMLLTPPYADIGVAAPLLMVFARLLQGFSAGGEFGASAALLVELSPVTRRGFYGSWLMFSMMFTLLLSAVINRLIIGVLSPDQFSLWGWRLPFVFGLILAPIGVYLRCQLPESMFSEMDKQDFITNRNELSTYSIKQRVAYLFQHEFSRLLIAAGLTVGGTSAVYVNFSYLPTFANHYLHFPMQTIFSILVASALLMLVLIPWIGMMADRLSCRGILIKSLLLLLLITYPLFAWFMHQPTGITLLLFQLCFCGMMAFYYGVYTICMVKLFPRAIRSTGLSISNNVAILLFGGLGQWMVTWLIERTHSLFVPCYYLLVTVAITLVSAVFLPDPIEQD